MEIVALTLLLICSIIGFAAIFFTTFGTLIIFSGTVLYAVMTNFSVISVKLLLVLGALYLLGEAFEYIFVIVGAKKFGATNAAIVGAVVGGILGAILGVGLFGVGLILGTFLGIFLGAFLVEWFIHRDLKRSLKAGAGGVIGRVGSIAAKVFLAIIMFVLMASAII